MYTLLIFIRTLKCVELATAHWQDQPRSRDRQEVSTQDLSLESLSQCSVSTPSRNLEELDSMKEYNLLRKQRINQVLTQYHLLI